MSHDFDRFHALFFLSHLAIDRQATVRKYFFFAHETRVLLICYTEIVCIRTTNAILEIEYVN